MNTGMAELVQKAPDEIKGFEGSEFPLPVILALYGRVPDVSELKAEAKKLIQIDLSNEENPPTEKEIEKILHLSLTLGEVIESSMNDRKEFFIQDAKFRNQVFSVKRSPGWALVLGDADQTELITRLKEKRFTVFSKFPNPGSNFLGNRKTSSIYFLQNLVRYAMVYGRTESGNPHEIAHFLEEDGPGILIVHGCQSEVESLLTLGYMLMGTPTIVPSSFPYPFGNRCIADSLDEILEESIRFPNLRIIEHEGSKIQLPDYCDPANLRQEVVIEKNLGDTDLSFFAVKRADVEDGVEVIGNPTKHLGIIIEMNYKGMNDVAAEFLEEVAAKFPNYIKGVKAVLGNSLTLGLARDIRITGSMIAETIHHGLKKQYPRLDKVRVTVIFDEDALREEKLKIDMYKAEREKNIASITDEGMDEFYCCVACQPFAREHACVIMPERPPQCGRDWRLMMVGAYLNPEDIPDTLSRRRKRISPNSFSVLKKGERIDPKRGEWSGVNEGIYRESGQRIKRVQIHSITGNFPHSSCGCFGYLAFYIPEVDGIGIMKKGFKGKAPNGMTWDILANMAGGKQKPGICGVSLNYLRSPKFLQGDGGYSRVVWMDQQSLNELKDVISNKFGIATENDFENMEHLKKFLRK